MSELTIVWDKIIEIKNQNEYYDIAQVLNEVVALNEDIKNTKYINIDTNLPEDIKNILIKHNEEVSLEAEIKTNRLEFLKNKFSILWQ